MMALDPRQWSVTKPKRMLVCFLGLTLLLGWGNIRLQKGAILDEDTILIESDPIRRMDQHVRDKVRDGFEGRESITFIFNQGIQSVEDLRAILDFTEAVKDTFGERVLSLSEIPAYRDTGEELLDEPYITAEIINSPDFDLEQWKQQVTKHPGVFGLFVGRDFSWASVVRYLPPDYDEITEFRTTVEFLEGRQIPLVEWFWKRDIEPTDPLLGVGGWTMGRGIMDQGMNVDMLLLVTLGVVLTLPVFWAVLGSFRAALLCVGVMIGGGFLWTRGALGLFGLHERVFSLMAYSNVIVQGTSFALHKFDAFRASQEHDSRQDSRAAWSKARAVDGLIAATAGIAFFGFATLWSFGLLPIRELGIASALGVSWVFVLAVVFLPAFHVLGGKHVAVSAQTRSNRLFVLCDAGLDRLVSGCVRIAVWLSQGRRPGGILFFMCGLFVLVAVLFSQGNIVSRTRALQFIRGTLVEKEAQFLNQPGNIGFEFFDLLVEPGERLAARRAENAENAIDDPRFLKRAWEFQTALKDVPQTREISSILSTVHHIARESFHKEFPDAEEEVGSIFFLIENGFVPSVQQQLYFSGGVRISVSYSMDDSVELGQFGDAILALARNEFADLKINAFNTAPLYPQVDKHVRWGKIKNVFSSQIGIALICGFLILWRNRRLRQTQLSAVWGGTVMSLPLFFATAFVGLLMWLLDIPLDMSTAAMGALTINAATDFSLYLAMAYHQALETHSPEEALPDALRREGKVIITDCLLNILCFLPLISSRFLPVRQIGWVMGVMLLTCAVATMIFMAALLPYCVKRKEALV